MERTRQRILLFAGTTEGRLLAEFLLGLDCCCTVSVATEYGREVLEHGLCMAQEKMGISGPFDMEIHCGRLDVEGIKSLIEEVKPGMVVDATHPYAEVVTENIKKACAGDPGVVLLRCLRDSGVQTEGTEVLSGAKRLGDAGALAGGDKPEASAEVFYFSYVEEAVKWLSSREGNVLVTTGSKELSSFNRIRDYTKRLYVRVLPEARSMDACKCLGFDREHIIALQGPFSAEENLLLLRKHNCRYLVTKDGGRLGGFKEKLSAAFEAGAAVLVIQRPDSGEGCSPEEVKMQLEKWCSHEKG